MKDTFRTAEVASLAGIHPNTVRLYEKTGLIPVANRESNGYRVFTSFHVEQLQLARKALQIEVLQSGLRKKIVSVVKLSAKRDFDQAISLAEEYLRGIRNERANAEEAVLIAERIIAKQSEEVSIALGRKEAAVLLGVSIDTLRNWELNGLISIRRKRNGYRVYTEEDIRLLKIIRTLRCANYSLQSILRMLRQLSKDPGTNIRKVLNTPQQEEDIVSVCDKLVVSLTSAERNARAIISMLRHMREKY